MLMLRTKRFELLFNIEPPTWMIILVNFLRELDNTCGNRNVILEKND